MELTLPMSRDGFVLREFIANDSEALAEIEYDPEVKNYLGLPSQNREEFIRKLRFSPELMRGWVIEALPEQLLAGRVVIGRTSTPGEAELEIVIAKAYWGRELGRKVAQTIIPAAFKDRNVSAVIAVVHPEHQASVKLVESLGFAYRGENQCPPDCLQRRHLIFVLSRIAYNSAFHSDAAR